jgi:peptidoglycan hydrolase CwlO-like protein
MAALLTSSNITFGLGILGIIFAVYNSIKNPQIDSDKDIVRLRDDMNSLSEEVSEIKEKHLASVELNIKELASTIHDLSITVTRLSTIIDERIPRT